MRDMRSLSAETKTSHRSRARRPARLAAWLLSLAATPLLLAQATVELEVQTTRPYASQPFWVKVRVHNAQQTEVPDFPDLPGCQVDYVGPQSQTHVSIDNAGRQVVTEKAYQFLIVARQSGELTIPAISVVADGKTLKTKPQRLTVRDLPQSPPPPGGRRDGRGQNRDLLLAEITCAQSKLFVGQRGSFTLTLWIKPAEYGGRPLPKSDMLRFITGSFGPFNTQNVRTGQTPLPQDDGSTELYYVVELPAEFVVQQPGPLAFSDVSVGLNYPTQFSRDFFGDLRVARHVPVPRMHPAITVPDVQALPTEGRPASFSGAVGQYQLNVMAVPTNVRVGDPIQLVIDISGDLIETLPGPALASIPKLLDGFRVPTETLAGTVSGNRKRFTQTIRAKRADVKEIPPIEFAYFDPQREEYVVARSEPIPILVSAVEQLDAADLTDITAQPSREPGSHLEARDGLRGNQTSESELLAATREVTMTQVVLTTAIPPLAFVCFWGVSALTHSRRDHALRRRRRALRNAERRIRAALANRLPPGEFHSEIEAALAGYLADRLNEPPARFLGRAAVTFLQERGVDRELVQRCAEVLERCEQAAYGGGSDGDTSLAEAARQCAKQLEGERL